MFWTPEQINKHKKAAKFLYKTIKESFKFISENKNITEFDVQQFIIKRFEHYGLKSDRDDPIVAFRENTSFVHYFPNRKSKQLKPKSLILIDIWARLKEKNSPYADITWMAYYGEKVPNNIKEVFSIVLKSRDTCVALIQKNLKKNIFITGKEAHEKVDQIIIKNGFDSSHFTGHSIGFRSPHGSFSGLTPKKSEPLRANLGYTIEPGIYLKDNFGVRSEIDFYIDNNRNIQITTKVQKKIVIIK